MQLEDRNCDLGGNCCFYSCIGIIDGPNDLIQKSNIYIYLFIYILFNPVVMRYFFTL